MADGEEKKRYIVQTNKGPGSGIESATVLDYYAELIDAKIVRSADEIPDKENATIEYINGADLYYSKKGDEIFAAIEFKRNRERVRRALNNTKEIIMGDKNYLERQLDQRIEGPDNSGSSYSGVTQEELLSELESAEWEKVEHEGVMTGCTAFKTKLPGLSGILDINNLPENTEFYAIDPKGTGNVGIGATNVQKTPVEETYIILGKNEGKEVVFTFHPGEPVSPSIVKIENLPEGTKLTREQVKSYGFSMAKFITPEMKKKFDEMNLIMDESTLSDLAQEKAELIREEKEVKTQYEELHKEDTEIGD